MQNLEIKSYNSNMVTITAGDEYVDIVIPCPDDLMLDGVLNIEAFTAYMQGFSLDSKPPRRVGDDLPGHFLAHSYEAIGNWDFTDYTDADVDGATISTTGGTVELVVDGKVWMKNNKFSIIELQSQIDDAYGNVLVSGLGLGIVALLVADKASVDSVTVIENDARVIKLFESQGFDTNKITITQEDIYKHVGTYDVALFDHYNTTETLSEDLPRYCEMLSGNIDATIYNFYLWEKLTTTYSEYIDIATSLNSAVYSEYRWASYVAGTPMIGIINAVLEINNRKLYLGNSKYLLAAMLVDAMHITKLNSDLPIEQDTDFTKDYFVYNLDTATYQAVGITWMHDDRLYSTKYQDGAITDFYEIYYDTEGIFSAELDIVTKEVMCTYLDNGDDKTSISGEVLQLNTPVTSPEDLPEEFTAMLDAQQFPYTDHTFYYAYKPYGKILEVSLKDMVL